MVFYELAHYNLKSYRFIVGLIEIAAEVPVYESRPVIKKKSGQSVNKHNNIIKYTFYGKMFFSLKFTLWRYLIFLFFTSTEIMNN